MTSREEMVWSMVYTKVLADMRIATDPSLLACTDRSDFVSMIFKKEDPASIRLAIDAAHAAVLNLRAAVGSANPEFGLKLYEMSHPKKDT